MLAFENIYRPPEVTELSSFSPLSNHRVQSTKLGFWEEFCFEDFASRILFVSSNRLEYEVSWLRNVDCFPPQKKNLLFDAQTLNKIDMYLKLAYLQTLLVDLQRPNTLF